MEPGFRLRVSANMTARTPILFAGTFVVALAAVFYWQPATVLSLKNAGSSEAPQPPATILHPVSFIDVSPDWLMIPTHQQTSAHLSDLTETLGSGLCAIDANRDGWMDIFFVGGSGHTRDYGRKAWWLNPSGNRLLLNQHGKYFIDATEAAGLATRHQGMGCAVADLNNDGFSDLFVSGIGKNHLYRNNGNGTFSALGPSSGIQNDHWSAGMALGDFNADGLIDIYLANYVLYRKGARAFEGTSGFKATGNIAFDASLYDPEPNRLYINQGNFQFADRARDLNLSNPQGRSLGAKWLDVNNDQWPDLLVINDHSSSNKLFLNNQGKSFTPAGKEYAPFELGGSHDVQIGDFDHNGQEDYFITRGATHPAVMLVRKEQAGSADTPGKPSYRDTARAAGLAPSHSLTFTAWGATQGDFNNDGHTDLYIANGSTLPDIDSVFVPLAQHNALLVNKGDGNFVLQQTMQNPLHPYSSRGSISVDLDNDGTLEILLSNNNNPMQILSNPNPVGNWIGLDFSTNLDTDNHGANMVASIGSNRIHKKLAPPGGFLSQGDPRVLIGLGNAETVDQLTISWNDGKSNSYTNLHNGHYYQVNKATGLIAQQKKTSDSPSTEDTNPFHGYSDAALNDLIGILLSAPQRHREIINRLWQQSASKTRISILAHINRSLDKTLLNFAMKALISREPEVLLQAIEIIRKAELESSIVRLIPLLQYPDTRVQCATARAFQFLFEEEEAVTHRKTLAVSPLIKLLENGSDETALCAANALAAAEKQRAVLPLLEQMQQRHDPKLKTAIIRALGLTRDTRATAHLHHWVERHSSSPAMVAAGLVALSRLNDPMLTSVFQASVTTSSRPLAERYDTLTQLYKSEDSIVFPQRMTRKIFDQLFEQHDPYSGSAPKKATLSMLNAIAAGKIRDYEPLLRELVEAVDKDIRQAALVAFADLGTLTSRQLLEDALLKLPLQEFARMLQHPSLADYSYSSNFVTRLGSALLEQLDQTSASFQHVLRSMNAMSGKRAAILFDVVSANLKQEGRILSVLNICADRAFKVLNVHQSLLTHNSVTIRSAYVDCIFNQQADNNQMQSFRLRFILRDIFNDPEVDDETKLHLMIKYAARDKVIAQTFLFSKLSELPSRWLRNAITAMKDIPLDAATETFLWNTFENHKHHGIRMKAASVLTSIDEERVHHHIQNEFAH